jgi:hypothetical protein
MKYFYVLLFLMLPSLAMAQNAPGSTQMFIGSNGFSSFVSGSNPLPVTIGGATYGTPSEATTAIGTNLPTGIVVGGSIEFIYVAGNQWYAR